ncbi:RIB43A-like with coiled-coils protein 2 isoform X1 [Oncorhynchus mykiss]|uniref:RIB43A-like with coiled-coils protein 2 isoform X1 n=2 Tax=Oncorhynchus mykiss TaxID=8022 RepID=UPI0018780535|nr:RIB43A-like with coiled-coils protein 2 isoform X1 [Oncorhynchus mykiss]XP_036833913.1 RIB43A-like with coiled-coils protein 2 isoform X1 [Oncorhynchus mykiss]
MNQDGIQMLPGLVGEDPDSQGRLKKQQEQLREWSVQQQHELATARHQQRLEEQQYDQDRVDLDIQALQLQKIEEERRRSAALATKDFNLAKAAENAEKQWKKWQQEEEDNRTDILNQLQGELLSKSQEQGISVLGLPHLRADSCKGLTNEQLQHVIDCHQQRIEEKSVHLPHLSVCLFCLFWDVCVEQSKIFSFDNLTLLEEMGWIASTMNADQAEQQKEALHHDRFCVTSARTALLLERRQARINKQLRRTLNSANAQLSEAHREQKKYLDNVYTNIPDDSYFSQFNTSSR